jgi:hypothetical protein
MSFVSSLPANLTKYGLLPTWDFAIGRERYAFVIHTRDYANGTDGHTLIRSDVDFIAGLEMSTVLLSQLDRAFVSERSGVRIVETVPIHLFDADSGRGVESGFVSLAQKYLDLQTGKITTTPTSQSVFIGLSGISGCIVIGDVKLCYKKIGDVLDWETLQGLLTAFKQIDDRIRKLIDTINK